MKNDSAQYLADFLNHGILPFVGREEQSDRIYRFWHSTTDAHGLRAALVLGEAGIGKSRLIEESIPKILAAGGAVIHAKLYPESATTIVPLLARSLWHSIVGRELLKREPDRDSLVASLKRIAGLRPTIIIIEDVHLLSSEGIRESAALLESLSDETISVVALSRPNIAASRSMLEQYLTEEIMLEGLGQNAFIDVCEHLFHGAIDEKVVEQLHKVTFGNALALRSALRGALKTGFLDRKDAKALWSMTVPPAAFYRHLENNVRSLSEGMAAHLDEEERTAADALAILGELFSVEAANVLLSDPSVMLERLRFKGMIVTSVSAHAPLVGEASSYPLLAFTHSLLHKYFYTHSHVWGDKIIQVLSAEIPLYGISPFLRLPDAELSDAVSYEELKGVLLKGLDLTRRLDFGLDWELAFSLWDALKLFFEKNKDSLSKDTRYEIEVELYRLRLTLLRRQRPAEEFRANLDTLLALTSEPQTNEEATRRMNAHVCEYWYLRRQEEYLTTIPDLKRRVEELVVKFPDVTITIGYHMFLTYLGQLATENRSYDEIDEVRKRVESVLAYPKSTPSIEEFCQANIYPYYLPFFNTAQERDDRLRLAEEIETSGNYQKGSFFTCKTDLYLLIGKMRDAEREIIRAQAYYAEHGFRYSLFSSGIKKIDCDIVLRGVSSTIFDEIKVCKDFLPNDPYTLEGANKMVVEHLMRSALLIGDTIFVGKLLEQFSSEENVTQPEQVLLWKLWSREAAEKGLLVKPLNPILQPIFADAHTLHAKYDDATFAHFTHLIKECIASDILTVDEALARAIIIEIILYLGHEDELKEDIQIALRSLYEWCIYAELPLALETFVKRYNSQFEDKEAKTWKSKLLKLRKSGDQKTGATTDEKIKLSMLGAIEFTLPDGRIERVRGARLRSVLGMITANLMLDDPLSHKEFCFVAAGEKDDADLARKTVNMAVASLRDDLGADALITTGDTPTMNLDAVHIDLLEASDLLNDASKHIRRGSIMKALPDAMRAFDLALGKVPFPTLYDNLFEALRDDFDSRLRKVALELSKRLISESDHISASALLRKYFDVVPDDEEISELLRSCLIEMDQRGEAERIRLKVLTEESAGS